MSHAQLTIKQIHNLRKKQSAALKSLTIIGYLEGTSFLLLLCIAMPLKYMLDIPEGVKYIGMALGSLLPFGPFIFDHLLKKNLQENVSKEA